MRNTTVVNKLISNIDTRNKKNETEIQAALIECACFAQERNTDPTIRLFKALGNGVNVKAAAHWITTYAPVMFSKDGVPKLNDKAQKSCQLTMEQFEAEVKAAPIWTSFNVDGNKASNIWETGAFVKKVDEYLLQAIRKAAKEDGELAAALDRAHSLFRSEVSKVVDIVEAA